MGLVIQPHFLFLRTMKDIAKEIYDIFLQNRNPATAKEQAQYMRNKFEFIGLKQPDRVALTKSFFLRFGKISATDSILLAKECFQYKEREMWYLGCEQLIKAKKILKEKDLNYIETIIIKSDWWDIVDTLATNVVGEIVLKECTAKDIMLKYSYSQNMWLRRVAVIFQLKYKDKTDATFLFERCRQLADEKEFFIQKAIGWALREYAKSSPKAVLAFVNDTNLANLCKREALKHLSKI